MKGETVSYKRFYFSSSIREFIVAIFRSIYVSHVMLYPRIIIHTFFQYLYSCLKFKFLPCRFYFHKFFYFSV